MADDITLTVRVRDLTRGDFRQLRERMRGMKGDIRQVAQASNLASDRAKRMSESIKGVSQRMKELHRTGSMSRHEMAHMRKTMGLLTRDLANARQSGELTKKQFKSLSAQMARTRLDFDYLDREITLHSAVAQDAHRAEMRRQREAAAQMRANAALIRAQMAQRRAAAAAEAASGGSRLGEAAGRHPVWATAIAGGMHLIIGLAPALAAALSVVAGGAFIALGAYALKGSKQVKDAFAGLKDALKTTFSDAAQPMESFLVDGMNRASASVRQLGPAFKDAFAAAGPLIKPLVDALANLVGRMLPGLTAALKNSGPAFEGFAKAMGSIGAGIGGMFEAIAAQPEGLKRSWEVLGEGIQHVLVTFGEFLGTAANSERALGTLKFLFDALATVIKVFDTALAVLDSRLGKTVEQFFELVTLTGPIKDALGFLADQLGLTSDVSVKASGSTKSFGTAALRAAEHATKQANAVRDVISSLKELNNKNRTTFDARANLERVIDDATEQAKGLSPADFKGGFFNLDTEAGREAHRLVSDISEATSNLVDKLTEAKAPQDQINEAWVRGREQLVALADEFDLTEEQMRGVADAILAIPDRDIRVEAEVQSTLAGLQEVKNKVATTKGKSIVVDALTEDAQTALRDLGFKVKETKGKQLKITIPTGRPKEDAKIIQGAIDSIRGKSVTVTINTVKTLTHAFNTASKILNPFGNADGSIMKFYADGGTENHVAQIAPAGAMRVWAEPETGGEAYIPFAQSKRPRSRAIAAEAVDRLGGAVEWFASGGVRSKAKGAKDEIRAATSGSTEKRLLKLMDAIVKGTMKMSTALKSVSKELTKAKDRLRDLKDSAASLARSVKSGLIGEADITKSANAEESQVTINTLLSQMTGSAANTKQFSGMLSQLRKRGLSKTLLQQIAEAGIEGGGMETAAAILGGGSSELKRLNSLQSQISKYAGSAGKTTADAMYAAQIKSQEKLVKALDGLSKALKKVTKKKATGGIIGAASGGLTLVGEQGPEVVRLPFGSSVYSNPDSRRIAASGGGGGSQPIVVQLSLGGRHLGEVLIDPLRKSISHRGGNVQAVLGS